MSVMNRVGPVGGTTAVYSDSHARIVVVCPVCKPDLHLALKWLAWSRWLATKTESTYDLVVFGAKSLDADHIIQLKQAISGWDKARFEQNPTYYERPELGYAAMANSEFRNAIEMTERLFPGRPTLWSEPDAIPTRPSWVQEIDKEYAECDAEFLGDFHALGAIPHMTGNAVYSANWRKVAPSIAKLPMPNPAQGWDTLCCVDTLPQSARSRLIQQAWIVPPPRFNEVELKRVHPSTALFHRCKDGSLIDILSKRQGGPEIPLTPAIARPTGTKLHKLIVQQPVKAITAPEQFAPRKPKGPYPQMEILIVSHKKDAEFLQFCLRSIDQYARGFAGVKVVAPDTDVPYFIGVPEKTQFIPYREIPGKGMLQHMIQKCRADEHCPDADFVLHMDSDCMMWQPTTPNDFLPNGKCLIVRQHYDVVQKLNRARMKWRENVKAATGYIPEYDTMVRHPNVFPRDLYAHVRAQVEDHTGRDFNSYVFDGQDKFPQSFCEFVTLGNIGLRDFSPHFQPTDYDHEADSRECGIMDRRHQYIYRPGRDKIVEFWSHGGFSKYRMDANRFLRGSLPKFYLK